MSTVHELMPYVPKTHVGCMVSAMESIADFRVLIVSYNLMERNCDKLLQRRFNFVILVCGYFAICFQSCQPHVSVSRTNRIC